MFPILVACSLGNTGAAIPAKVRLTPAAANKVVSKYFFTAGSDLAIVAPTRVPISLPNAHAMK
jgi:hypothetical protein